MTNLVILRISRPVKRAASVVSAVSAERKADLADSVTWATSSAAFSAVVELGKRGRYAARIYATIWKSLWKKPLWA